MKKNYNNNEDNNNNTVGYNANKNELCETKFISISDEDAKSGVSDHFCNSEQSQ